MKRVAPLAILVASALTLAACGSSTSTTASSPVVATTPPATTTTPPPPPPPPKVVAGLDITPDHNMTGTQATISGTIEPAKAHVSIEGKRVLVRNGDYHAAVTVSHHGGNTFTVKGTMPGYESYTADVVLTRDFTAAERATQRQAAIAKRAADKQQYISNAATIPYDELNKNADAQAGKVVTYHGQVFQIQEETGLGGIMLVSVTQDEYGLWDNHIWVNYQGHVTANENDMVTFTGTVVGSKSYDTQSGGTTYVPEVDGKYITVG